MTTEEKAKQIINDIRQEKGNSPVRIFKTMAAKDYISMHGPEHHILDGAAILQTFHNAGGTIDLDRSLETLCREGLKMPGAMCGHWGVCGAVASIGAALAVIDNTGPLSDDGTWGSHMSFTADAIRELGEINGPRCCKRNAMIAFKHAVNYINKHYDVKLDYEAEPCEFSACNSQCIKERCPFYVRENSNE